MNEPLAPMKTLPNMVWIGFDWKSAELFMLALFSGDQNLMEAIKSKDIHRGVGSMVTGKSPESISDLEREVYKTGTYALIYSSFDFDTAKKAIRRELPHITAAQLDNFELQYRATFSVLLNWVAKAQRDWFMEGGQVHYYLGALRNLPYPEHFKYSPENVGKNKQARVAINTYGQNSIGLMMKQFYSGLKRNRFLRANTAQHIPIFDAAYMLANTEHLGKILEELNVLATPIISHNGNQVRMRADWKYSTTSWGEMKHLELDPSTEDSEPIVYTFNDTDFTWYKENQIPVVEVSKFNPFSVGAAS